MEKESGARDGVRSFHRRLDYDKLRCVICPDRAASWRIEDTDIVLSDFASAVLVKNRRITPKSLVLYRSKEYDTYRNPSEPLSASAQLFFGAIGNIVTGLVTAPAAILKPSVDVQIMAQIRKCQTAQRDMEILIPPPQGILASILMTTHGN
ncbi:hypothetical protein KXV52_006440 [Aspergillus fumigatus]|nr:hypothetical protein KXV66_002267 [Aspergillus fumigatus]KAH3357177.1 hypothetical protein KXV52_006440 [Aspergillus fumigatus]